MRCSDDLLQKLEFHVIRERVQSRCLTDEARHYIQQRTLHSSRTDIQYELKIIAEWKRALERNAPVLDLQFPKIASILSTLASKNPSLTALEMSQLARYLQSTQQIHTWITEQKNLPLLKEQFGNIGAIRESIDLITASIDAKGFLRIKNIPALSELREYIFKTRTKVERALKRIIAQYPSYLQSQTIVMRNNRMALALNVEHMRKLSAIVVGRSASGSTVYVEPLSCIALNNDWVDAEQQFSNASLQFLYELSQTLALQLPVLQSCMHKMCWCDSLLARAHFSRTFNCAPAENSQRGLILYGARHPLLGDDASPIDIILKESHTCLVICGPNGGGKSVTMKTVGLLMVMHHFGMEIPVQQQSAVPLCDQLFLLIGDNQSITEHASSFTAQMQYVAHTLQHATTRSLILYDELGSSTDPDEGAALSVAILKESIAKKAITIFTTHFMQVKEFAHKERAAQLAAMECRTVNAQLVYRLHSGLMGSSNALSAAQAAGIASHIIDHAKKIIGQAAIAYKEKHAQLITVEQALQFRAAEIATQEAQLALQKKRLTEKEIQVMQNKILEIDTVLATGRQSIESLVQSLREKNVAIDTKRINRTLSTHAQQLQQVAQQSEAAIKERATHLRSASFEVGDVVLVKEGNLPMEIIQKISAHMFMVSSGTVRMQAAAHELTPVAADQRTSFVRGSSFQGGTASYLPTLDIRGKFAHEVAATLLQHIDSALYNNARKFSIIHGSGSGALQKEVKRILNQHLHLLQWEYAPLQDGGQGKTVVTFIPKDIPKESSKKKERR